MCIIGLLLVAIILEPLVKAYMTFCVFIGTLGQYTHVGVLVGEPVTLSCYGYYRYIEWRQNSEIIVQSGQLLENDTERFNFTCDNSWNCKLTILNAQVEDSGEYWCIDYHYWLTEYYARVTVIRKLCAAV